MSKDAKLLVLTITITAPKRLSDSTWKTVSAKLESGIRQSANEIMNQTIVEWIQPSMHDSMTIHITDIY